MVEILGTAPAWSLVHQVGGKPGQLWWWTWDQWTSTLFGVFRTDQEFESSWTSKFCSDCVPLYVSYDGESLATWGLAGC